MYFELSVTSGLLFHSQVWRADIQYRPKIMHAQELLFASASRQLLAAFCGSLALGS